MSRKEELYRQRAEIMAEINAIEDAEQAEINRHKLGKCYKVQNSYSCPDGPEDYWWFYARVDAISAHGVPIGLRFETDKYGKFESESGRISHCLDWVEISPSEFSEAWLEAMERMGNAFATPSAAMGAV